MVRKASAAKETKASAVKAEVAEVAAPTPVAPVEKKEVSSRIKVTVTWNGGSREYSLKIHGENFEQLAKQFASQYREAVIV